MAKEFRDALATLMDEGTYETILAGWGAQNGAHRRGAAQRRPALSARLSRFRSCPKSAGLG